MKRDDLIWEIFGDIFVGFRQGFKVFAVTVAQRQVTKLSGVMQELEARGAGQRLCRYGSAVFTAAQFISSRQVIKRTATFAFRQPEKTERAVGLVMLRLQRACALEC